MRAGRALDEGCDAFTDGAVAEGDARDAISAGGGVRILELLHLCTHTHMSPCTVSATAVRAVVKGKIRGAGDGPAREIHQTGASRLC